MDFMLGIGRIAWNMPAKLKGVFRTTLDNVTWRMYVAKHMLKGKYLIDEIESPILLPLVIGKHPPKANIEIRTCMHLVLICGLETRFWKSLGIHSADTCDRSSNHMTICVNPKCRISAHSHVSYKNKWFAFKIPEF